MKKLRRYEFSLGFFLNPYQQPHSRTRNASGDTRAPTSARSESEAVNEAALGQTNEFQPNPSAGPTGIFVHSKFGGQIFGFDIDQNGTEGLLAESKLLANGNVLAAVETFDQATGNILNVVELRRL
jgi:hypothetical protein